MKRRKAKPPAQAVFRFANPQLVLSDRIREQRKEVKRLERLIAKSEEWQQKHDLKPDLLAAQRELLQLIDKRERLKKNKK